MKTLIFFLYFILFFNITPPAGTLVVEVTNIERLEGMVWIGIYDSDANFLIKEQSILKGYDVYQTGSLTAVIDDLPYGTYAMAIFHDVNNNGELDQNVLGIPAEPFAFSQLPRSKWRIPKFREVQFDFTSDGQVVVTPLRKWWDKWKD